MTAAHSHCSQLAQPARVAAAQTPLETFAQAIAAHAADAQAAEAAKARAATTFLDLPLELVRLGALAQVAQHNHNMTAGLGGTARWLEYCDVFSAPQTAGRHRRRMRMRMRRAWTELQVAHSHVLTRPPCAAAGGHLCGGRLQPRGQVWPTVGRLFAHCQP